MEFLGFLCLKNNSNFPINKVSIQFHSISITIFSAVFVTQLMKSLVPNLISFFSSIARFNVEELRSTLLKHGD